MNENIRIRREGHAGRITLTRPKALNALSYDMAMAIDAALTEWAGMPEVALVVIDAEGDKAFCAGGDIEELYSRGKAGDFAFGRTFWRDEYRLNARLAEYPKPIVAFLQGFVMGGGVGVGCHASHRIVGESAQIAMPECGIGLVPDVGGSLLLARAPGRLGEHLGLTAARMNAGDAIYAGFADHYLPEGDWDALKNRLCATGDAGEVARAACPAPVSDLEAEQDRIDALYDAGALDRILSAAQADGSEAAQAAAKALQRNSPLSMACTLRMLPALRDSDVDIRTALRQEYRFTARAMEDGDFLEGIRAQIIDRDRNPKWKHDLGAVPEAAVEAMLAPLGADELTF